MKSDAEFCRTEYLRCCEQYRATSPELKRHRDASRKKERLRYEETDEGG